MKTLKTLIGAASLLALAAFAFSPPADASPRGYQAGGHDAHWPARHWHKHRHWGPRISIGFVAPILPTGFVTLNVGGLPYYYHGGYFYRPAPTGYVVVSAPLGAAVTALPASAVRVEIGGAIYYRHANTYYQWHPARRAYVVVPAPVAAPAAPLPPTATTSAYTPGQVLETLPTGYTAEVINGIQYYRYGDDYFMPTQRDGREVYVVVRL
ncbi:DUF6515 family protein [Microbulbifer thermotolerans]|uniref:DUF6515 family protein n=3 Tax=Microbulbifer thermotolerans TaxID=252514 RepID=A0A143HIW2_MICTH|nr:DUF6515 family protein [Microbulbifer thermotolerans]AMX01420.1 hypothetical protein A3224_01440 [Microbulbifer thermotolerans]MCX2778254.1 DUF6515 family protein [Microbulbifer thermotolerans]MCX2782023.1 DUF6515 family protein [Microbulbifer thermotolerans]MCX2783219.1 DUF6515 family protein [Microbulbifer thermotolerans]MCX2795588.1 DUF6515 family protein [Microbulbifer thermotolerans]